MTRNFFMGDKRSLPMKKERERGGHVEHEEEVGGRAIYTR